MSGTVDARWARSWITTAAEVLAEHRVELITLDREIGDGDHGENMDRGFHAVRERVEEMPPDATPGDVMKAVATTLISTVGGAAGPLYGTAFLKAALSAGAATELDAPALLPPSRRPGTASCCEARRSSATRP